MAFAPAVAAEPPSSGKADGLARFKREYPEALARLKRAYAHVRASGTRIKIFDDDQSGRGMKVEIDVSSSLRKATLTSHYQSSDEPEPAYQYVYCLGRNETFVANRDFRKGARFTIKDVQSGHGGEAGAFNNASIDFGLWAGRFLFAPYKTDLFNAGDLLDEDRFVLGGAKEKIEEGRSIMTADYIFKKSKKAARRGGDRSSS